MRRRAVVAAAAALVAAAVAATPASADRYLAVDGVDAGLCETASAPCATFQYAADQVAPGETIRLAAGDYSVDAFSTATVWESRITVAGPQAGVPAPGRTGPEATIPVETAGGLTLLGSRATVDGVRLAAEGSGTPNATAIFAGAGSITIRNTIVEGTELGVAGVGPLTVTDSEIRGVTGIRLSDGFLALEDSVVMGSDSGLVLANATGVTATRTTFAGTTAAVRLGAQVVAADLDGNRFVPGAGPAILNASDTTAYAELSWWGCNGGPDAPGCATTSGPVAGEPHLVLSASAGPAVVAPGGTSTLTAGLTRDSAGDPASPGPIAGARVVFAASAGALAPTVADLGPDGTATSQLTAPPMPSTVEWTATLDGQTVTDTVVVERPVAVLAPSSHTWGDVPVGGRDDQVFQVTAGSGVPLDVTDVAIAGTDAADFAIAEDHCTAGVVAPGQSCTIVVRFAPTAQALRSATLRVTTDATPAVVEAALSGRGVAPPVATVSPGSLAFGARNRGTVSEPRTVTVVNTGASTMQVDGLTKTGTGKSQFGIYDDACTGELLPPDATCTFAVRFIPQTAGSWTPRIEVRNNGRNGVLRLSGTGIEPLVPSTRTLDFGDVPRGDSAVRTLTVTNAGTEPLGFAAPTLKGTGRSLFSVVDDGCLGTLAPGASCTIDVRFAPQAVGAWAPTMTVLTEAGPLYVELRGAGVPAIAVSPSPYDFGPVVRGGSATRTFTLSNRSGRTVSLTGIEREGAGRSLLSFAPGNCTTPIAAGGSCAFSVTFAPTTAGSWTPALTIRTDAGNALLRLAGQGT